MGKKPASKLIKIQEIMIKMLKIFRTLINDIFLTLITNISGPTGRKIRYWYWKRRFKKCGRNVMIDEGVIIQGPEWISIGDNVWIDKYCILIAGPVNLDGKIVKRKENKNFKFTEGELLIENNVHLAPFCLIQAHGGVYIGNNSGFSSNVKIYSLSNLPINPYNDTQIIYFTPLNENCVYFISPVVLDDNVGCALNTIILPGVFIGRNSFVAPNSVVLTSFKENSYISGNPAKFIRERFKIYG